MQERALFHKNPQTYIMQNSIKIYARLDINAVKGALSLLPVRHEALRSFFQYRGTDRPEQVILCARDLDFQLLDFTGISAKDSENAVDAYAEKDAARGFNLDKDSLLRVTCVMLPDNQSELLWTTHKTIMDGWSLSILLRDFFRFYLILTHGTMLETLKANVIQERGESASFGDYLEWFQRKKPNADYAYWADLLSDYIEETFVRPLNPNAPKQPPNSKHIRAALNKYACKHLKSAGAKYDFNVCVMLEAAWALTLMTHAGARDVVFGKMVSGRDIDVSHPESIVGPLVNIIPVRAACSKNDPILHFLRAVQKQSIESGLRDDCPLAEIQLHHDGGHDRAELPQSLFICENDNRSILLADLPSEAKMETESRVDNTAHPLTMKISVSDKIDLELIYEASEYSAADARLLFVHYEQILESMSIHDFTLPISTLDVPVAAERAKIFQVFNATHFSRPLNATIVDLFEKQAQTAPKRTAMLFEGLAFTYEELNEGADRLAAELRARGIGENDFVALMAQRSVEMIIGMLGIIKAGAVFTPICPDDAEERVRFLLNSCKPKAIVVFGAALSAGLRAATAWSASEAVPMIDLAQLNKFSGSFSDPPMITLDTVAYCLHTSEGAGVLLTHDNIVNFCANPSVLKVIRESGTPPVFLSMSGFTHGIFAAEVMLPLLNGFSFALADEEEKADPRKLNILSQKENVSILQATPDEIKMFMPDAARGAFLSRLGVIILMGETLTPAVFKQLRPLTDAKIYHVYGAVETTFWAALKEITAEDDIDAGKPIANTRVYILDGMDLCGIGAPGEICVTGAGLAQGYFNRTELTAQKFIANPFDKGRLYRTGDLGRWLPNGAIDFLGRLETRTDAPAAPPREIYLKENTENTDGDACGKPCALELSAAIDLKRLEEAYARLLRRHAADAAEAVVETYYMETLDVEIQNQLIREFARPFDIQKPPLTRLKLIRSLGEKSLLLFDAHPSVAGAMALPLYLRELMDLYDEMTPAEPIPEEPVLEEPVLEEPAKEPALEESAEELHQERAGELAEEPIEELAAKGMPALESMQELREMTGLDQEELLEILASVNNF
jgi:amino acid adenylation domain-containing protein